MTDIILMYVNMFFIALSESFFMRFIAITIIYIATWIYKNPKHNCYYPEKE